MSGHEAAKAMRETGWSVAIHNDYRLNGERMTFWLWTHPNGRWVKGEGETDEVALGECLRAIPAQPPAATTLTASDFTAPGPVVAESAATDPRDAALAKYLCPIGAENGSVTCSAGSCPECAAARADAMIAQRDAALKLARDALTESGESLQLIGECRLGLGAPGDGKDRKADAEDNFGVYATLRRITCTLAAIDAIGAKP